MRKYAAIILYSSDTNEFDRVYILYTREMGMVRVVARGVRKPEAKLAGHLEPGTLSEIYIARSKGMGQITSAITLDDFENIKKNFEGLCKFFEISHFFLKNFSEEEKDERIFDLLKEFLEVLDRSFKTKFWEKSQGLALGENLVTEGFWWKLVDFLGKRPQIIKCAVCQKELAETGKKYFSLKKGGIICEICSKEKERIFPINNNQVKMLRIFLANSLGKFFKVKIAFQELYKLRKIRKLFLVYNF